MVCSTLDNKPIEYRDEATGTAAGLGIDTLAEMAKVSGRGILVKPVTESAQFRWLNDGKCNVVSSSLTAEDIKAAKAAGTNPYYAGELVVLARSGEGNDAPNAAWLREQRVGVVSGSLADKQLQAWGMSGSKIRRFPAAADTFAALNINKLDPDKGVEAVLGDRAALAFRASKDPTLTIGEVIQTGKSLLFAVKADDSESLQRLNEELVAVAASGHLAEINKTYLEPYTP